MLYQFHETVNSSKIGKAFIEEITDIYSILKNTFKVEDLTDDPLLDASAIQLIIKIGIIQSEDEIEDFAKFINKQCPFSYNDFLSYIKKVDASYNHTSSSWDASPINKFCNSYRKRMSELEEVSNKPTLVDLFSGAGGMSLGFKQEGFKISFANDIEQCCIETYIHNHPEVPKEFIYQDDINNIINDIPYYIRYENTDIVIGGPPCQGFSNANRQRIINDPRNKLYKAYVQIVSKLQPKFFVMENVVGMKTVAEQVQEDFKEIGYEVTYQVLNSIDFGVPQNRKRLIFIGNNIGIDNDKLFEEIEQNNKSIQKHVLGDAIENLRELTASTVKNSTKLEIEEHGRKIDCNPFYEKDTHYQKLINDDVTADPFTFNHKARYNNDRDIEIFRRLYPGDKSDDPKIADIMPYQSRNHIFKDKYFKLENDKPSKTITAHMKFDCNMYIHPTQARGLTPREAARIQTYPDHYYFKGAYTKTYMQVGNSVPPLMSRGIARVIKKFI